MQNLTYYIESCLKEGKQTEAFAYIKEWQNTLGSAQKKHLASLLAEIELIQKRCEEAQK